ncbi:hypothetical protein PsorP6_005055 [Peronosclerospora sorghi]|uniref:Uncharacterized protein n=1 Tax=Peronosclerospora sorghi TaxID=230839 RepID=A0ACC0W6B9_9STRA|nr:hypothetical protein PsorP6_005055 [Peronosclerospora sorghi]
MNKELGYEEAGKDEFKVRDASAETDNGSKNETTPNTVVKVVLSGVVDESDLDTEIISEQSSVSSDVNAIKALIDEDTEFSGRRGWNSHGSGEGKKDVRDEFEDEEQLLGFQGDRQEEPEPPSEQKSEDTGLKMQDDFEGTMHDMPDDEEGEQNESKYREELDREMRDFDQNDETLWMQNCGVKILTTMRIELTRKSKSLRKTPR